MSVSDQLARFEIIKVDNGHATNQEDCVAVEEPLELRIAGDTIATTMRTPGDDVFLAQGFFYNEGFIDHRSQVGDVFHCGRTGDTGYGNTIELLPAPGVMLNFEDKKGYKRGTLVNSACGVCGREQIDDLLKRCTPFDDFLPVNTNCVKKCLTQLSSHQPLFEQTGGVHAAASLRTVGISCLRLKMLADTMLQIRSLVDYSNKIK